MTKGNLLLLSGVLILLSILVQLLKFIQTLNKDRIDGFSGALFGVGLAYQLYALLKRKNG